MFNMFAHHFIQLVSVLVYIILVTYGHDINLENDVMIKRVRRNHHQNVTQVLTDLFSNTSINIGNATTAADNTTSSNTSSLTGNEITTTKPPVSTTSSRSSTTSTTMTSSTTSSRPTTTTVSSTSTKFRTTQKPDQVDSKCKQLPLIQNFCPVSADLVEVSFWDIYDILYSATVLETLVLECTKGVWCLNDRFDYWEGLVMERVEMVMNSEIMAAVCGLEETSCLNKMISFYTNCTSHAQMMYVKESVNLVCHLKQNPDLTTECYKHVLSILHVTMADISRKEDTASKHYSTCESPGSNMTKNLICVTNSCPSEIEAINGFFPWAWFTVVVEDVIQECHFDPNKCESLLQSPRSMFLQGDIQAMIGVSIAAMVTAVLMAIAVCTCYRRHRRNVVIKEGYQQLLSEGDES